MLYVLLPTVVVIVAVLALLLGPFAGIAALVAALVVVGLLLSRRAANVTVETSNPEPTGVPRKGTGSADTANHRVGQT